jgi:hypothetical protein
MAALATSVLSLIAPSKWNGAMAQEASVPEAPVGHRQPKATDVPQEETESPTEKVIDELDRALAQKLQGKICRGC